MFIKTIYGIKKPGSNLQKNQYTDLSGCKNKEQDWLAIVYEPNT